MRASACVGRVGGLAVALGIGAAVAFGYAGSASAAPADDSTTTSSASGSATTSAAGPRSRRTATPKAVTPQRNNSSPVPDPAARVSAANPVSLPAPTLDRVRISSQTGSAEPPAALVPAVTTVATAVVEPAAAVAAPARAVATTARLKAAAAVALGDLAGNGAPAQGPAGWVVYAAVRRQAVSRITAAAASTSTGQLFTAPIASKAASASSANPILSFFFNQTPTESPTQSPQDADGVITGDLNASDPDSDAITYSVVSGPTKGSVTIDATGQFVYTPDPKLAHDGLTDTFTVSVSDASSGFHIHGIMGLLGLLTFGLIGGDPHSTTTTVGLSVTPVNKVPTATTTVGTPDPSTGVVTGTVIGSDADGDPLTYAGSTTAKGTAVVDETSGAFTYTPTAQARHAAAKLDATAAAKSDTFTITVADDHGGALAVPITTAIVGANVAPTATQNAGIPNTTSGVVAGAVIGSDADSDPLTYTLSAAAAKGAVTLNANGSFTYTPTALARHNAAFNADTTDTFVVTVADGYGGSVNVPVAVTISPASVTFDWANGSGSQYWTAGNLAALNTAATRLSSYIVVATPVTITTTLIGQNNPGSNFLASSFTNFSSSSPGYYGTVVQRKILTGTDANGASADSQLTWNFAYPWALGDTVPGNQYDFQSVAMHEIMHSLGFLSGIGSPGSIDNNWSTYDSFLSTSAGSPVVNPDYSWNTAYNANLTGGNGGLYFNGPNAVAVYGSPVPLYTPGTWTSGSSVTHLNATPVKPIGTTGYLMDPSDGYGLGVRVVTPVELGILRDLGYTVVTPSSASFFLIVGFGLIRRRRR